MSIRKAISALMLALPLSLPALAQFRLPQVDVDIKGMLSFFDAQTNNVDNTFSLSVQGGAHIQINQYIAVGGYYGRSFMGKVKYNEGGSSSTDYDTKLLIYGGDLRLSTGRSAKWRPYLVLSYGKLEFVEKQSINLAMSATTMGANAGIMLRLGNNLYWNVVEVGGKILSDKIYWLDSDFMPEAKTGFTYNIRVKSK